MRFTREQMERARKADLYDYLIRTCPDRFKKEGDSLRPKENHSISIKRGYCGYKDFANGEAGNSVDYLVKQMGMDIVRAVNDLSGAHILLPSPSENNNVRSYLSRADPVFPEPEKGSYRQMYAYLHQRGISYTTIQKLVNNKLLYQYEDVIGNRVYHNMLFINLERDFGEKHGTISYGTSFHGVVKNTRADGYWYFSVGENAKKVYICEAAIDTVSLYEMKHESAVYISVAGSTGKQAAIDRIKGQMRDLELILAVDNDDAGESCRRKNTDIFSIIPVHKDWNEDLQSNIKRAI